MQLQFIDNCMENKRVDDKSIDRRLQENDRVEDTWNAKKSHPGQIQFRVRGWMANRQWGRLGFRIFPRPGLAAVSRFDVGLNSPAWVPGVAFVIFGGAQIVALRS